MNVTTAFEITVSVDASAYGLSDNVVAVAYTGSAVIVSYEVDGRDLEVRGEPGSPDDMERLAATAARDPKRYAEQTLQAQVDAKLRKWLAA